MTRLRLRLLIGLTVAAALAFSASPDIRAAAKAGAKATANAAKSVATTVATAAAPQGKSKNQQDTGTACTVNGKTLNPCPPALLKQVKRQAARQNAAPQKKGVAVRFAGLSPTSATSSPLTQLGTGTITTLATMSAPNSQPDYFAVGNWANSPLPVIANGTISGGLHKFIDTLPGFCGVNYSSTSSGTNNLGQCLPLAKKDGTVTFSGDPAGGSDFYRIGLGEFSLKMHSELPATKLRGYSDMFTGGYTPQYLGPIILAQRNRPVRLLFQNNLPPGGHLQVPVDTTYMGAGLISDGTTSEMSSDQRAVVHLHGGNTPWISDGTPHQWITPAGDAVSPVLGFAKGFSTRNVPDMPGALNFTPSLTDGKTTYYFTNQQSGRLMFYHEHAYGTTRLGVYAGEAAGYLLVDPTQEGLLAAAGAPGTIQNPGNPLDTLNDISHVVPLVIQDKTFVPDSGVDGGQLAAQDPTWDVAKWGGAGALWFPHVYMPNQNPADLTGANGFGRWDYGPWFWPPQDPSTFVAGGQPYACSSAAYPGGAGLAYPPLMCPGTPLPSGTPEAFMDTPVVNGTAYPTMNVDPRAYRFQVLNAANDRSLNLGLYLAEPVTISLASGGSGYALAPTVAIADTKGNCGDGVYSATISNGAVTGISVVTPPTSTTCGPTGVVTITPATGDPGTGALATASFYADVKMVPAIPASAGRATPNCSASNTMYGGGQVEALLDASGNPINNTGLPTGCWPLYDSGKLGYTAGPVGENGQLSWGNSDSRTGGVPDPGLAGPPIIQLGAEGGVLPKLTVIPSTPVSYDYNKRSITVLNVLNHGLWVGPAERADIVVDFSQFAGKTLIVYNDAPAPVPAGDPRQDYYTNDPDLSSSGGAPTTLAGYGPNTRTIMQVVVNPCSGTCSALNVGTLAGAIPNIFVQTQDPVILPESAYPVGNGNGPDTYIPIQATSVQAWTGGAIGGIALTDGGAGYTSVPTVTIDPPVSGTTATATAAIAGPVASFSVTNGGKGYTSSPVVTISGGGGAGASAVAVLSSTLSVTSIAVTNGGAGYKTIPTVVITAPPCTVGTTGCAQATATATIKSGKVTAVTVTNSGAGYTSAPTVTLTGGGFTTVATASATMGKWVASLTLTAAGSGYTSAPTVSFSGGGGSGATATAVLGSKVVTTITLTNAGSGYSAAPAVTITGGGTPTRNATAVATPPATNALLPKTIQELFTLDYGRMNATLGVEIPLTNFTTQTTIPYGYADPPTELFKDGETQFWKITHNGVDTHFIHFHLFTVQVINRVGWDGAIKPPDPYELGMKDTVRMNPLEDIIVALRPFKQSLNFPVPNSSRPMDVTRPVGSAGNWFTNVDPTGQPAAVTNSVVNFGWEYVWHCHILGHEENDMMRAMVLAVAPAVPGVTTATGPKKGQITLTITATLGNNVSAPTGFTIARSTSATGPWTTVGSVPALVGATQATATFTDTGRTSNATYYYQVVSNNLVGYTAAYTAPAVGYPHPSADSLPATVSGIAK